MMRFDIEFGEIWRRTELSPSREVVSQAWNLAKVRATPITMTMTDDVTVDGNSRTLCPVSLVEIRHSVNLP